MRLVRIHLAGFKSFVDPTTLEVPGRRVGIVGPNGCGKSNTIDAVRWVMGESSAKHLRGDDAADVIFSGSATRKPVGQAHVELVFDNRDGRLGGAWSRFSEIAIRREITRDGPSKYWLNGHRARRRDVLDLFLGTGLGPRSYAIIEQGMIARLIEAKPEELRNTIEEAAGISRYKERRRETEQRIRQTRENLERLNDLRDELRRQIARLEHQAEAARLYRELAAEQRRLAAERAALTLWTAAVAFHTAAQRARALGEQVGLARARADAASARLDTEREARRALEAAFAAAQAHYYQTQNAANHARGRLAAAEREAALALEAIAALEARSETLTREDEDLDTRLRDAEAECARRSDELTALRDELARAERDEHARAAEEQAARDAERRLREALAEPRTQAQVERAAMDRLAQTLERLAQRRARIDERLAQLDPGADVLDGEQAAARALAAARDRLPELEAAHRQAVHARDEAQAGFEQAREAVYRLGRERDALRGQIEGQRAAIETDGSVDEQALNGWLADQGPITPEAAGASSRPNVPTLGMRLEVAPGWESAAETVLGDWLRAVLLTRRPDRAPPPGARCVVMPATPLGSAPARATASLAGCEDTATRDTAGDRASADSAAQAAPADGEPAWLWQRLNLALDVPPGLRRVATAEDETEARRRLADPRVESVVLRDGRWLGRAWWWVPGGDPTRGLLERARALRALEADLEAREADLRAAEAAQARASSELAAAERHAQQARAALDEHRRALVGLEQQWRRFEDRRQAREAERARLLAERAEIDEEYAQDRAALTAAEGRRNAALARFEGLEREVGEVEARLQAAIAAHREASAALRALRARQAEADAARRLGEQARANAVRERERLQRDRRQIAEELDALRETHAARLRALPDLRAAADASLEQEREADQKLAAARTALERCDATLEALRAAQGEATRELDALRERAEAARIEAATAENALRDALAGLRQAARAWLEGAGVVVGVPASATRDAAAGTPTDAGVAPGAVATDSADGDPPAPASEDIGPNGSQRAATTSRWIDHLGAINWFSAAEDAHWRMRLTSDALRDGLLAVAADGVVGATIGDDAPERDPESTDALFAGVAAWTSEMPQARANDAAAARRDDAAAALRERCERLEWVERRIRALGPIHLAAIDELDEVTGRARYLDEQHDDLTTALATLEAAMDKIDRETKALFKTTFDAINGEFGNKFRLLFGGGEARLELTDDDLLATGVTIVARPPGKRLSTIHLMSGGEKSLTALALVFAIFSLNPAPFCMLDEVDAPLDEANVGRFCRMLEVMSQETQFLFISHNKATMQVAEQLIGVTMAEPGVSRLVSVDLERALDLAETVV